MKKVLFILILAVLSIPNLSFAQGNQQTIGAVSVEAETVLVEPVYDFYYDGSVFYDGVVGFQFTISNIKDTLNGLYFEGGYNAGFVHIDSINVYIDGTYSLSQSPPEYNKYRLRAVTAVGDTVTLENIVYYAKETKVK